jgi:hypothetical protein
MALQLTPARKRIAVVVALAGVVLVVDRVIAFGGDEGEAPAAARVAAPRERVGEPPISATSAASAPARLRLDWLEARSAAAAASQNVGALFAPQSWQPPPPKVVPPPPPPPPEPVAPPFPYTYIGGMTDAGVRTAFFARGDRALPVRVGDTVDAAYRVDQLTENQMNLTYLPLDRAMTLSLGSAR